jgi:quinol monooxygenase YgiN
MGTRGTVGAMSHVVVVAKITAQEGKRPDVVAGMAPMLEHVETEEGTLIYVLNEDVKHDDVVWMYEVYTDQQAFEAHGRSDMMKAIGATIGPFLAGPPELIFLRPVGGKGR